MTEGAGENVRN